MYSQRILECVCVCVRAGGVRVINGPCVFPQSVGVSRSTDRQWSMRSLRCRVLVRTFKVSSLWLIFTSLTVQAQQFIAHMHRFLRPSAVVFLTGRMQRRPRWNGKPTILSLKRFSILRYFNFSIFFFFSFFYCLFYYCWFKDLSCSLSVCTHL